MQKFLPFLLAAFFFISCQKETNNGGNTDPQPLPEQTTLNVNYGSGSDTAQRMDVYLPAGRTTTATKALIMIHGGAWVSGDKADMTPYVTILKSRLPDYAVFNINYHLAALPSTNTFPTQENDTKAALAFIVSKAQEYKINADKIAILGASAGGHLALLQAYKYSSPKLKAVVDFFGPADMAGLYNFYSTSPVNQFLLSALMGGTPTTNASLYQSSSPVNFVSSSSQPTLILHGTADPIVPYAQSTALKTKLETAGVYVSLVTYTGAGHGDWTDAQFNDAYDKAVNFLKDKNP